MLLNESRSTRASSSGFLIEMKTITIVESFLVLGPAVWYVVPIVACHNVCLLFFQVLLAVLQERPRVSSALQSRYVKVSTIDDR